MSKTLRFKAYCFELYKNEKKITGRQAIDLFEKYNILTYINDVYDVLHSTGDSDIVYDIDMYINARKTS